ncbi:heme-binding domain-containing protein [Aureitalea sp. L0-47]|uniref:heme-binding domain-containing protein n=1 Tax=Aureitalea sp. L0-47 TaxID=2816962 RepID=UPI0022381DBA|nr:heme-binding domain-containing protein [Aureitalea sp. L0-47]MCW5519134.1 heme-binding domain-containing protein [Aureitalea sp. L0-47]
MIKKVLKILGYLGILALIVIQFIRPEKNEAGYEAFKAFEAETKPSSEVVGILKANCYDCHSNHTNYPWYAEVAPVSLWLEEHVDHGKDELNVSEWASYSVKKKDHKLEELIEEVEEGHMPLDSYTWIHGTLSEDDKTTLIQWATLARLQYKTQLEVSAQ